MKSMKFNRLLATSCSLCVSATALAEIYTYDSLNRLVSVAFSGGGVQTFSYDAAGNLLAMRTTGGTVVPGVLSIAPVTGASNGSSVTSAAITVAGITGTAAIGVTGGEYQVNGGAWTSTAGVVRDGDIVHVRVTAGTQPNSVTRATLTIGNTSGSFTVTTASGPTASSCTRPVSSVLFAEDFSAALSPTKWSVDSAGGSVVSGGGKVSVTGAGSSRFPYVQAVGNPVPATGDFSVYCKSQYLHLGSSGTGSCVVAEKVVAPGSVWWTFDSGSSFSNSNSTFGMYIGSNTLSSTPVQSDGAAHEMETCFIGSTATTYIDGLQVASVALPSTWVRPRFIWFGNPVLGGSDWTTFETSQIEVRALGETTPSVLTDTECFFNWAEMRLPTLLTPAKQPTQTAGTLLYRSYPSTSVYVGLSGTSVLAMGGVLGSTPLNLGVLGDYLPMARAASCN